MARVKVERRDGSEVSIDLAQCARGEMDGKTYYQSPEGWWFHEIDKGWTHTTKTYSAGSKTPAVLSSSRRQFAYRESELLPAKALPAINPSETRQRNRAAVIKAHPMAKQILDLLGDGKRRTEPMIKTDLEAKNGEVISKSTLHHAILAMRKCRPPMLLNERKGENRGYYLPD